LCFPPEVFAPVKAIFPPTGGFKVKVVAGAMRLGKSLRFLE